MSGLDATARPVQLSAKEANTLRGCARFLDRKNFKLAAATIDGLLAQYDGAEHLALVDRRTLLAVESRDAGLRARLRRGS